MTPPAINSARLWLLAAWLLSVSDPSVAALGQTTDSTASRSRFGWRSNSNETTSPYRRSPPLKPTAGPIGDPRLARLDAATREVVEAELRDASPAEREHWLDLIAGIDANQVYFLLDSRRRAIAGQGADQPPDLVQRPIQMPAISPVSRTAHSPATLPVQPITATAPTQSLEPPSPGETDPGPAENSVDAAADAPAAPPPHRRWMAPLRGRWGDGRNATETEPAVPAVEAPPPINSPENSQSRSSAYMNVELQRVMTLLRTELVDAEKTGLSVSDPAYRRMHVQMRLLHLLADEPEQALQAIPNLPAEQQEFWIQYLWALHNELDITRESNPPDRLHRTSELLTSAQQQLSHAAPLDIPKAAFCHRINSFGNYESFAQNEFQPGQPLLIYAEVANFQSELQVDNRYRTQMRTVAEIYPAGPDGLPLPTSSALHRRDFPATEDLSRSLRRDYFHSYRLDLPNQLPAGRYVLRLSLTDDIAGKSAQTSLPFGIR